MPGPNGEVRKTSTVQRAVQVMRIATGEEQEQWEKPKKATKRKSGGAGGNRTLTT